MTMTTAEFGAELAHATEEHKQIKASTMYLLALLILVITGAMVAIFGLGGLILTAVVASWVILAFLVLLTAGG